MVHDEVPSTQKRSRESRAASKALRQAGRRTLKRQADPNSDCKDTWAEKVMIHLYEIACQDNSALNLQAIKLVVEVTGEQVPERQKGPKSEPDLDDGLPDGLSDEELDAEIVELQAQHASLKASEQ